MVVLDEHRHVTWCERHAGAGTLRRLLVDEIKPTVVCIDAPSAWASSGAHRSAELALLSEGFHFFWTPSEDRAVRFHDWMRAGFAMYHALAPAYRMYTGGPLEGTSVECFPHATARILGGDVPASSKHRFRREVLRRQGVEVDALRGLDQVDAALAALTGLFALEGRHRSLGGDDGLLVVPIRMSA